MVTITLKLAREHFSCHRANETVTVSCDFTNARRNINCHPRCVNLRWAINLRWAA
jgi:hypothetical protein